MLSSASSPPLKAPPQYVNIPSGQSLDETDFNFVLSELLSRNRATLQSLIRRPESQECADLTLFQCWAREEQCTWVGVGENTGCQANTPPVETSLYRISHGLYHPIFVEMPEPK
jgi:hypothetical protein